LRDRRAEIAADLGAELFSVTRDRRPRRVENHVQRIGTAADGAIGDELRANVVVGARRPCRNGERPRDL
jgi:hypothetical protein